METKPEVTSKQYSLNVKDFVRGLLMAVIVPVLAQAQIWLEAGSLKMDWDMLRVLAISGGVGYLIKNFFQPAQVKQTISNAEVTALKDDAVKAAK